MGKNKALILGVIVALLISVVLISGCVPGGEPAEEGTGNWTMIIFLVLIFAMFYFLMIRPQRKRQKDHQKLVQELNKGDRVITAGGIYGRVVSVREKTCVVEIGKGTQVTLQRAAVRARQDDSTSAVGMV